MQNYQPEMEKAAAAVMGKVLRGIGKYLPSFGRKVSPAVENVPYARRMGQLRSRMLSPEEWRIHRVEQRLGRKLYPGEMASPDTARRLVSPTNTATYKPILTNNPRLNSIINRPGLRDAVHSTFKQDHDIASALYPFGRPNSSLFAKRLP